MKNLVIKTPTSKKFVNKIEIWSTHNLLHRKFAVSVKKLQLLGPPTFLIYDVPGVPTDTF